MLASAIHTGRAQALPSYHVQNGNCIHAMKQMPAETVDLIVTDPPYLVNYRDRQGRSIASDDASGYWLEPAFKGMYRLLKQNSYCVCFYGFQAVDRFMGAWRAAGFTPVGQFIWHKAYASSTGHTEFRHEAAYLLAKGYPVKPEKPLASVMPWVYSGNHLHPTEKAVGILRPLIETYSRQGDMVLDPFCGSGSTLVAARALKRQALGIELNRKFVLTATRRLHTVVP